MQNISDKADSTAGATGELTASEYNNHKNEMQGSVTRSGQTLSAATLLQQSKAMFINGAGASSVQDGGAADSIILSPITGASGLVVPDSYAHFDGGLLLFEKSSPNTTTAVTVNFGQTGTELGAKSLVRQDGTVPLAGDVDGLCLIKWNNSADKWVLLDNGSGEFGYATAATGTITPKFRSNRIISDTSGGANTITLADGLFKGQRATIETDGAGLTYVKGTGVYVDDLAVGVPITDGLKATWTWDGSSWVADPAICAFYLTGGDTWTVTKDTIGAMEQIKTDTKDNGTTSGVTFTFPNDFTAEPRLVAAQQRGGSTTFMFANSSTASDFEMLVAATSGGLSTANRIFGAIAKGMY